MSITNMNNNPVIYENTVGYEHNLDNTNKYNIVINRYLNEEFNSEWIRRYDLQPPLAWTSGDSIFRLDSRLARDFKFITVKGNKRIRYTWEVNDEEKIRIDSEVALLDFSDENLGIGIYNENPDIQRRTRAAVHFIKFYGKKEEPSPTYPIREDIKEYYRKLPCAHCTREPTNDFPTQCDHKNDLYNDPRVLCMDTQIRDDFQPLCGRCNSRKARFKQKMIERKQRISAREMGYNLDFQYGDETLNLDDPYWYKGTYWGDVLLFKQNLTFINDKITLSSNNDVDNITLTMQDLNIQ